MRIRIVLSLVLAFTAWGCATMRDTIEGRESGTARLITAPFDSTWAAAVDAMRGYPTAEIDKTRGVLVTDWVDRLVEPEAFGQHGILKERTRFEIAIAARDGGSRVTVRRTVELFSPVFVDPVAPGQRVFCQYPLPEKIVGPGTSSALYSSYLCALENPWETPRGSPVYVWRSSSQVQNAPATRSNQREQEILDAIEAAAKGISEQGNASGASATR